MFKKEELFFDISAILTYHQKHQQLTKMADLSSFHSVLTNLMKFIKKTNYSLFLVISRLCNITLNKYRSLMTDKLTQRKQKDAWMSLALDTDNSTAEYYHF